MTIRTRHGTLVRIIRKLPTFISNGQETERVEVEIIDARSKMCGSVTDVRLDVLRESRDGEIAEAMGGVEE